MSLCNLLDYSSQGFSVHGDSPGKNNRGGCHSLFQGIFPTQGSKPGLQHCKQILYCLSHQGSPTFNQFLFPLTPTSSILKSYLFYYVLLVFEGQLTYNTMLVPGIQHSDLIFYAFQNDHIDKSVCHLLPYKILHTIDHISHTIYFIPMTYFVTELCTS